jgi:cytochrome c-type biogenesis protein
MEFSAPSFGLAFVAGLASFLSPCVFALVPAYISYLGGRAVASSNGKSAAATLNTLSHGVAFVLGFSFVFILLGLISSSVGAVLQNLQGYLAIIGGLVTIILGLHLAGVFTIRFLEYDLRPANNVQRNRSYFSSAMMGVFFSAGWTPCIGPVLGVILTLAANGGSPAQGAVLLGVYSAGLAIPFLLAATQISWVTYLLKRHAKLGMYVQRAMGVILVVVGVLLLSGRLSTLNTLGVYFDIFEEGRIGVSLLLTILASLLIGAGMGWWAQRSGKPFVENWFLGTGISLLGFVVLSFLGVRIF